MFLVICLIEISFQSTRKLGIDFFCVVKIDLRSRHFKHKWITNENGEVKKKYGELSGVCVCVCASSCGKCQMDKICQKGLLTGNTELR